MMETVPKALRTPGLGAWFQGSQLSLFQATKNQSASELSPQTCVEL